MNFQRQIICLLEPYKAKIWKDLCPICFRGSNPDPVFFRRLDPDKVLLDPKLLMCDLLLLHDISLLFEWLNIIDLDLCILFPPLPGSLGKKGGSFNVIRSHLFKILYRYLEEQPDLRTALAEPKKMTTVQKARELVYELERRYSNVDNEKESENGEMKGDNEKIG